MQCIWQALCGYVANHAGTPALLVHFFCRCCSSMQSLQCQCNGVLDSGSATWSLAILTILCRLQNDDSLSTAETWSSCFKFGNRHLSPRTSARNGRLNQTVQPQGPAACTQETHRCPTELAPTRRWCSLNLVCSILLPTPNLGTGRVWNASAAGAVWQRARRRWLSDEALRGRAVALALASRRWLALLLVRSRCLKQSPQASAAGVGSRSLPALTHSAAGGS